MQDLAGPGFELQISRTRGTCVDRTVIEAVTLKHMLRVLIPSGQSAMVNFASACKYLCLKIFLVILVKNTVYI